MKYKGNIVLLLPIKLLLPPYPREGALFENVLETLYAISWFL